MIGEPPLRENIPQLMGEILVGKGETPKSLLGEHVNYYVLQNLISCFFKQIDTLAILVKLVVALLDDLFWGSFDKYSDTVIFPLLIKFAWYIFDCNH